MTEKFVEQLPPVFISGQALRQGEGLDPLVQLSEGLFGDEGNPFTPGEIGIETPVELAAGNITMVEGQVNIVVPPAKPTGLAFSGH